MFDVHFSTWYSITRNQKLNIVNSYKERLREVPYEARQPTQFVKWCQITQSTLL